MTRKAKCKMMNERPRFLSEFNTSELYQKRQPFIITLIKTQNENRIRQIQYNAAIVNFLLGTY